MGLPQSRYFPSVMMLGTLPPVPGISSYCLELVRKMTELCSVDFLSFKKIYPSLFYPGGRLIEDWTFPRFEHPNLTVRHTLTWYNPWQWLREGVKSDSAILHVQWWSLPLAPIIAGVCLGFRLRGRPVVMTIHNVSLHEKSILFSTACRMLCTLANRVIVHTASGRKSLSLHHGVALRKIAVVSHGPLDFYVREDIDRDVLRKEIGFEPNHRVILMFGAIRPYKGLDTALHALAQVMKEIPATRLLVVGKPWEPWDRYETLARDLGVRKAVIPYLGYIPSGDVYRFFEVADLVVLPYHRFEAQSGVGATAVSFRKPLVVSNVGGLPELVTDTRFVVPPGDSSSLALVLSQCLSDPSVLAEMAENAETVAERISWKAVAAKTRSLYDEALRETNVYKI